MPARPVTLREVAGRGLWHRLRRTDEVLCSACGTARFREVTDRTLVAGWWGLTGLVATPWAAFLNRQAWRQALAAGAPREWTAPDGPRWVGPPLRRRRGFSVTAALAACVVAVAVLVALAGPDDEYVDVDRLPGRCIAFRDETATRFDPVDCERRHDAKVVTVVDQQDGCPPGTESVLRLDMVTGPDRFACLDERP